MNINSLLLPVGGAVLGYLVGNKETAVRNSALGAAIGFAANWFMKPATAEQYEDLPPQGEMVPVDTEVYETPSPHYTPAPEPEDAGYIPDDGESSQWIGKDPFPVGAIARFVAPFATSASTQATHAVKMANGNWVTQPGQHVYWTSIGALARDVRVGVMDVIDTHAQTSYWTASDPQPLATYP